MIFPLRRKEKKGTMEAIERVKEKQRHFGHKGFLMEQNLHNLLR